LGGGGDLGILPVEVADVGGDVVILGSPSDMMMRMINRIDENKSGFKLYVTEPDRVQEG
jgi:hypothetical protein